MLSLEPFFFDTIRCLQDAEVLLKLTEEVNATLRNKVILLLLFLFFSSYFYSLESASILSRSVSHMMLNTLFLSFLL